MTQASIDQDDKIKDNSRRKRLNEDPGRNKRMFNTLLSTLHNPSGKRGQSGRRMEIDEERKEKRGDAGKIDSRGAEPQKNEAQFGVGSNGVELKTEVEPKTEIEPKTKAEPKTGIDSKSGIEPQSLNENSMIIDENQDINVWEDHRESNRRKKQHFINNMVLYTDQSPCVAYRPKILTEDQEKRLEPS